MFTLVLGQKPLLCYAAFPTSTAVQHANIIATYARPRCPCSACSRLPAREVAAGRASSLATNPTHGIRPCPMCCGGRACTARGHWRWTPAPIYSSAPDAQTPAAFMTLCGLGAKWKSKLTQGAVHGRLWPYSICGNWEVNSHLAVFPILWYVLQDVSWYIMILLLEQEFPSQPLTYSFLLHSL